MHELELQSLIDDLLNTIPNDVQLILLDAISQLMNFLNDKTDFPHKCIPLRSFPNNLKDIFHRFASIDRNVNWPNYGPCNREQLIELDLVMNPYRLSSWTELLAIKISQFDKLLNSTDLTKINFADMESLKIAIDTCYDKCQRLNRAETNPNANHLWSYGLFAYKLCNFFMKGNTMRNDFDGIFTSKRLSLSWELARQTLVSYLNTDSSVALDARQKCRCYFMLGKIAEKQHPTAIDDMLKCYLLAEKQLFDLDDDTTVLWMKIEICFRITASIYKFMVRAEKSIDNHQYELLIQVLNRNKCRLFNKNQLISRANYVKTTDENGNRTDGQPAHQQQVNDIFKICTDDFEWYLELWPVHYKAIYYLIKINFGKNENRCRSLLLQFPRKTIGEEKKLSLFEIHRCQGLFKVKEPLPMDMIHDTSSFNKYMEKCVHLLVEYLVSKCNATSLTSHVVLTLQWIKMKKASFRNYVNQQQKDRLFEIILSGFIQNATKYVNQINSKTAKTKQFADFFASIYELYTNCESYIKSAHFATFSKFMIACYHLINESGDQHGGEEEFQHVLAHCAEKLSEKNQFLADKKNNNEKVTQKSKQNE